MAPSANPATPPSATSQPLSPLAAMTPYRNSTTSLPSRSTATPTTTASANSDFEPSTTARPAARNSPASSLPCRAIQTLCKVSITTAMTRIAALNSSCPMPANRFDKAPAKTATRQAAKTPTTTPPPIHWLRCRTVRVTASTMPMIRPASKTSRKTMISAAITTRSCLLLFDHQCAAGDLLVILVEEFVAAGLLRAHVDGGVAAAGDHLLDLQGLAFEFHRLGVEILQLDHDRGIGGRGDLDRLEFLVLVAQLDFGGALRVRRNSGNRR